MRVHRGRVLCWLAPLLLATPLARGQGDVPEAVADCLLCHEDDELTLTFDDGEEIPLAIDGQAFLASVHGKELVCTDCHAGYADGDHPSGETFPSRRAYVQGAYDLCKPCHFETYTRTLESVHFELLRQGRQDVPACSDCHGAHAIQDPRGKHLMMSRACGRCHKEVFERYRASVHGSALTEDGGDAPGCAGCHTAHELRKPHEVRFLLASPRTCLSCHGDEAMMRRHGLATTIGETYLADFHGVTAALAETEKPEDAELVVVCIDCHGTHDMRSPKAVGAAGMKERVREVCARCHKDAGVDFPAAWLSHYPPSLRHAPLVFLVKMFYSVLIPFMVVGLLLQVGLHLYRVGARR